MKKETIKKAAADKPKSVRKKKRPAAPIVNLNPLKREPTKYQDDIEDINTKKRTAKEPTECDACNWLKTKLTKEMAKKFTPEEYKAVLNAQNAGFMILKGAQYIEETGKFRGKEYKSRYILAIHKINNKFNVYQSN